MCGPEQEILSMLYDKKRAQLRYASLWETCEMLNIFCGIKLHTTESDLRSWLGTASHSATKNLKNE